MFLLEKISVVINNAVNNKDLRNVKNNKKNFQKIVKILIKKMSI